MKPIILFNLLIISGLSLSAQNLTNVQYANNTDNNPNGNDQQYVNTNFNQSVQYTNITVQSRGNRGGAAGNVRNNPNSNPVANDVQVSNQKKIVAKPKKQIQTNVGNVIDNNINYVVPNNSNGNLWVNDNNNINETKNKVNVVNQPIVVNKPVDTKKVYGSLDFKPSGLSGKGYTGGKLKKGHKNFYTQSTSKSKSHHSKRKPSHKKLKHHTSKCANW